MTDPDICSVETEQWTRLHKHTPGKGVSSQGRAARDPSRNLCINESKYTTPWISYSVPVAHYPDLAFSQKKNWRSWGDKMEREVSVAHPCTYPPFAELNEVNSSQNVRKRLDAAQLPWWCPSIWHNIMLLSSRLFFSPPHQLQVPYDNKHRPDEERGSLLVPTL